MLKFLKALFCAKPIENTQAPTVPDYLGFDNVKPKVEVKRTRVVKKASVVAKKTTKRKAAVKK